LFLFGIARRIRGTGPTNPVTSSFCDNSRMGNGAPIIGQGFSSLHLNGGCTVS
jgi:hypothetical protein